MSPLTTSAERTSLLLVDGHAYAYRAYFAIRSLNSPTGEPTNAIYGFIKMLGKMRAAIQPSHLAVIWDGGLAAERQQLLPDYKAHRPPMPESLAAQIDQIQSYLAAAGISSLSADGVEADDWIATLADHAAAADFNVIIASSDKDFMQLVTPRIGLLNPSDKTETVWGIEQVRTKTGVTPSQIVDWLSLIGDSVDNIPGVPGVGVKTATDLISQFSSIDEIFNRLSEIKTERLRGNLEAARATLVRNRALISLKRDLPLPANLDELSVGSPSTEQLRTLYQNWGFKQLTQELPAATAQQGVLL